MYRTLQRLRLWILSIDPVWQNLINLCLLLVFILALLLGDERLERAQTVAVIMAPLLFMGNLILLLALNAVRRRQLDPSETGSSFAAFHSPEQFGQLFSGRVDFQQGLTRIRGSIPSFTFMRRADSRSDIEALTDINFAAFRNTAWHDHRARKLSRNLALWEKNGHTFWVMDSFSFRLGHTMLPAPRPRPFFFSSVLPLTKNGFERYFLDRLAGDNDFRADWIAGEGAEAHCVLMFTFARDPHLAKQVASDTGDLLRYYIRCVGVHLEHILRAHFGLGVQASVYFQNSDPSFRRLATLAGMEETQLRSRDGERVYVTTVVVESGASTIS